jgi:hypothetical protein
VGEYAIPLGEVSCLLGFAALAATTGDRETASRHLASVKAAGRYPFRTPADVIVYRQTVRAVRGLAQPEHRRAVSSRGSSNPCQSSPRGRTRTNRSEQHDRRAGARHVGLTAA